MREEEEDDVKRRGRRKEGGAVTVHFSARTSLRFVSLTLWSSRDSAGPTLAAIGLWSSWLWVEALLVLFDWSGVGTVRVTSSVHRQLVGPRAASKNWQLIFTTGLFLSECQCSCQL